MSYYFPNYSQKSAVQTRVSRIAEAFPNQVIRSYRQKNCDTWKRGQPPGARKQLPGIKENGTPACRRGWSAKPKKTERRLNQNRRRDTKRSSHEHRRDSVWKQVPENSSDICRPQCASSKNVIQRFCP